VRIRHYGILGNNRRKRDIQTARAIFQHRTPLRSFRPATLPKKPMGCPSCGKTGIRLVGFTDAAGLLHRIGNPAPRCDSS